MNQGLSGKGHPRRYGATDVPEVAFGGGLTGALVGVGLAGDSNASEFSPTELYNLRENITSNIYTINNGFKTVEQELRSIGTHKDTESLREQIHNTHVRCNELVKQTTNELSRLTEVVRRGNKEQKLLADRLREQFSQAVTNYCRAQKQISDKMKRHILVTSPASPEEGETQDDSERLLAYERHQQAQKLVRNELEFQAGLIEETLERTQSIENDIIDFNAVMKQLHIMTLEQGEAVASIETNIENVHGNVELGRQQLQKASGYQNKYRRKLLCLLTTALIVITVLGIVIYLSVR